MPSAVVLSASEDAELKALLEAQYGGESLTGFIDRVAPHEPPPWHIRELLIPHLEQARTKPKRLLISMPPRHAKSVTIMRALIWHLQRTPAALSAYLSYNSDQAQDQSRTMRLLARTAGLRLRDDTKGVGLWRTPQGGGLLATGINGGVTGKGIKGWLVIDDPHKNRKEAESPIIRGAVWDSFRGDLYNRLEDDASVIIVQTRWHREDLIGRILAGELEDGQDWEVIEMPALRSSRTGQAADDDTPDEELVALWPERFGVPKLKTIRAVSGPYNWWSIYQAKPRRKGGAVFHEPTRYDRKSWKPDGHWIIIGADPAATAKTSADWSVAVAMAMKGFGDNAEAWILEIQRHQESVPQFARRVLAMAKRYRCKVAVEAVSGFKSVPQTMREAAPGLDIEEVYPATDKFERAQPLAGAWNLGRVHVPDYGDDEEEPAEVTEYLRCFERFTGLGDAQDDDVDATAHAWNALYRADPPRRESW
jgi:predicted phage terminase large subunit-like protein